MPAGPHVLVAWRSVSGGWRKKNIPDPQSARCRRIPPMDPQSCPLPPYCMSPGWKQSKPGNYFICVCLCVCACTHSLIGPLGTENRQVAAAHQATTLQFILTGLAFKGEASQQTIKLNEFMPLRIHFLLSSLPVEWGRGGWREEKNKKASFTYCEVLLIFGLPLKPILVSVSWIPPAN